MMYQDHLDMWQLEKEQTSSSSQSGSTSPESSGHRGSSGSPPSTAPANKKWATQDDWETYRPKITRLYDKEDKTLAQVMDILEREHGFHATTKMYKTRFKRWGLWKNTRAADVTDIILQRPDTKQPAADGSHLLVNGRLLDKKKVDAYIKRRRRQVIARLGQHPDGMSSLMVASSPAARPVDAPSGFRAEEYLYRGVRDYYNSRLSSGWWTWNSVTSVRHGTEAEIKATQLQGDFFERFKLAIPMLRDPTDRGAEGVKMMRICFAEVGKLLQGECTMLLFCILAIMSHLRRVGDNLHFLQVQLLRHLASLSAALKHPTASIWHALHQSVASQSLDNYRSFQCCNVVISELDKALGPLHAKTAEWAVVSMTFADDDLDVREERYRRLISGLDALGTFDERHAGVRMNYSAFYLRYAKYEESAEVILEILRDPDKVKVLQNDPFILYKLWWRMGQIRYLQHNYSEAEVYYGEALKIARARFELGEKAKLLDCLASIEKCLRDQGKTTEADAVLTEREGLVRASLESVGEKEDSVTPLVAQNTQ
ncbi:hypothetical protein GQ53DRAFT_535268 [Thozetella sp. PMI_491]|nr:hypothetical protein GQ53DRAFT_535268 [Thozetella sp. PMI_491]